ncbi:hypothetical protein [Duganella aceris]|uniref:SnoaL-like domain-containing protein n=1 Tax=Duganella aceris TaxID=2703883 RepID=A0ABX0FFR1_9BURK|nr:hypothetical protein [Duganella aceris]NGZ83359.1 hypothetical protein [Duganella aceris]
MTPNSDQAARAAPPPGPGDAWRAVLRSATAAEFAAAFRADVFLEATVFNGRAIGPDALRAFFGATRDMYDSIAFTAQLDDGWQTLLTWQGGAFGNRPLHGATLLRYDAHGLIAGVTLFHAPLDMALACSAYLRRQLGDSLGREVDWHTTPL